MLSESGGGLFRRGEGPAGTCGSRDSGGRAVCPRFSTSSGIVSNMGILEISTIDSEGGDLVGIVIGELCGGVLSITECPLRNLTDFLDEMLFTLLGVEGAPAS